MRFFFFKCQKVPLKGSSLTNLSAHSPSALLWDSSKVNPTPEVHYQQRAVLWQQSPPPSQLNNLVCKEETEIVAYLVPSLLTVFWLQRLFIRSDLWMTSSAVQREAVKQRLRLQNPVNRQTIILSYVHYRLYCLLTFQYEQNDYFR